MSIKPIRTDSDLQDAKDRLRKLLMNNNSQTVSDEIEILSVLVEQFERTSSPVASPSPVAAIKFRMHELGLSSRQLEPFIGTRARVSEVLSEKRGLSIDMIRALHQGLGIPYESLLSDGRQNASSERASAPAIARLKSLGFKLDQRRISTFIDSSLQHSATPALLRKTRTQRASSKTDQTALLLWQAAVLKKIESYGQSQCFDRSKLSPAYLRRIARLSSRDDGPLRAIQVLRECGIGVAVLAALPGTFLDGAAMLSPDRKPVIGLTLRHDRVDAFWFTLLHELAHITVHYDELVRENTAFVDDMEMRSEDLCEREADNLARDSLIPPDILDHVRWDLSTSYDEIVTVASRSRVHISVVAGRWQRDHQNYKKFARLIQRDTLRAMLSKE